MIFYLVLPFWAVALVVAQTVLADVLFSGWLVIEASLVVVICAGFRLNVVRGLILALVMGFVFDCLTGSVMGLFMLVYMVVFLLTFFVSERLVTEKLYIIAFFSLILSLMETLFLLLFYQWIYGINLAGSLLSVFLPQALMVSVMAVGFFYAMHRIEEMIYGKSMHSSQRAGTF